MPGRDGLVRPPFVALALVLLESATVAGGALRLIPSAPKPSAAESLLANAVSAAQSDLSRAQCAEVFSSFRNPDGRSRFLRREHVDPGLTTALLIHEELHSLGLRQNPPDTKEITARAIARYGR